MSAGKVAGFVGTVAAISAIAAVVIIDGPLGTDQATVTPQIVRPMQTETLVAANGSAYQALRVDIGEQIRGDSTQYPQTPPVLNERCGVPKDYKQFVQCIDEKAGSWYPAQVDRWTSESKIKWADVKCWAARTEDDKDYRVVEVIGNTEAEVSQTEARKAVQGLLGFYPEKLPVVYKNEIVNTGGFEHQQLVPFTQDKEQIRVSLPRLEYDDDDEVNRECASDDGVKMSKPDVTSGFFVDCYNLHWMRIYRAPVSRPAPSGGPTATTTRRPPPPVTTTTRRPPPPPPTGCINCPPPPPPPRCPDGTPPPCWTPPPPTPDKPFDPNEYVHDPEKPRVEVTGPATPPDVPAVPADLTPPGVEAPQEVIVDGASPEPPPQMTTSAPIPQAPEPEEPGVDDVDPGAIPIP